MADSKRLLDLAKALADAGRIDWERAVAESADEEEREVVELLRAIGEHAEVHRTRSKQAPPAPPEREIGNRRWGSLELIEKIGEGATAEVFRARDPRLHRDVALKLFRHGRPIEDALKRTVLDEGRHLARVRHENVVAVYGAGDHEGRVGIWMELVEGMTLAALVAQQGPYGADECTIIGVAVARALAAVHREHMVHGDVKAQNVMRESGGRIVLMDFSTSRGLAEGLAEHGSDPAGTPLYMAPELWQGAGPSVESDVYALGVLLFHLATGKFPVWGASLTELEQAQQSGDRRLLRDERPGLPEGFVRTVERALSREPEARFRSAGAFADALQRRGDGATEPPSTLPGELRALAAFARGIAVVGGVLAVLLMLGFVTSTASDVTLGRTGEFASSSLGAWLVVGARSLVLPLVQMLLVAALVAVGSYLLQLRRRADGRSLGDRIAPGTAARWLLLASLGGLAAIYWWYSDLIGALTSLLGQTVDPRSLALLGPEHRGLYLSYRRVLAVFVFLVGYAVYRVSGLARQRGRPVPVRELLPSSIVAAAAVLLMTFPYQLMSHNEFERAEIEGERAYIIGDNTSDVLLFCPSARGPKNRVVPADDPRLRRLGWVESLFASAGED